MITGMFAYSDQLKAFPFQVFLHLHLHFTFFF